MSAFQWLVLAACLLLLACANAAPSEALPLRLLAKGNFSGFPEAKQEVIQTKADWERAWAKLSVRVKDADKVPVVDFSKEMVILVTLGQQRTGGYSIEITKVEEAGGKLRISVQRREPDPGALVLQVITAPFHALAVPKRELKPEFIDLKTHSK